MLKEPVKTGDWVKAVPVENPDAPIVYGQATHSLDFPGSAVLDLLTSDGPFTVNVNYYDVAVERRNLIARRTETRAGTRSFTAMLLNARDIRDGDVVSVDGSPFFTAGHPQVEPGTGKLRIGGLTVTPATLVTVWV